MRFGRVAYHCFSREWGECRRKKRGFRISSLREDINSVGLCWVTE
jgi:hypothetical protein